MLIGSLKGLLAALALGYLAGCAAPCGAPGRLCAPGQANTSAPEQARAAAAGMPSFSQARPGTPQDRAAPASTPARATLAPARIALLVPLQSDTLGLPAQAVRDGFLAAFEHDREGLEVEVVSTSDAPEQVLQAYSRAAANNDIVVGPLARSSVGALAASGAVTKPTVALNHPEQGVTLPPNMLAIGLSIEEEARQAADWAAREHPQGRALILAGSGGWQQRAAQAFELRWSELGRNSHMAELPADDGRVDPAAIDQVRTRMEVDPPELMFAALDAVQLLQVRAVLGTAVVCYAASPANPGRQPGQSMPGLDGLRLLDLPWEVQPQHQAVMVYPRWVEDSHTLEIDRLYALGIDAFRVARALALRPDAPVELDGVTGKLSVALASPAAFRRTEAATVYRDGAYEPAPVR
jgi:outer membrane PBP1 activator LpoA protein